MATREKPIRDVFTAVPAPLVEDSMTPTPQGSHDWDDIDPTAFTDEDGTIQPIQKTSTGLSTSPQNPKSLKRRFLT